MPKLNKFRVRLETGNNGTEEPARVSFNNPTISQTSKVASGGSFQISTSVDSSNSTAGNSTE